MIQTSKQLNIDLWDAWIEFDQMHPDHFGTLYITGEVEISKKSKQPLTIMKEENTAFTNTLVLRIQNELTETESVVEEVMYSEPLINLNLYTAILIYSGNELIAVMQDIEILV